MPVGGRKLVTTPILKKVWNAVSDVMPTTSSVPNRSRAWRASQNPRMMSRANSAMMTHAPTMPSSSQAMEKI